MFRFSILLSVLVSDGLNLDAGKATIYWPGDGQSGSHKADGSKFTKKDNHIAHRYIPIGTKGILCNLRTKKCTPTTIKDRGPFGAIRLCKFGIPKPYKVAGKVFKAYRIVWKRKCHYWQAQPYKLQEGFRYRGKFDITKNVAKRINHRAFDEVVFLYKDKKEQKIASN